MELVAHRIVGRTRMVVNTGTCVLFARIRLGKHIFRKTNDCENSVFDVGINRICIVLNLRYIIGGKKL